MVLYPILFVHLIPPLNRKTLKLGDSDVAHSRGLVVGNDKITESFLGEGTSFRTLLAWFDQFSLSSSALMDTGSILPSGQVRARRLRSRQTMV